MWRPEELKILSGESPVRKSNLFADLSASASTESGQLLPDFVPRGHDWVMPVARSA